MANIYKKNGWDVYVIPLYRRFWVYFVIVLTLSVLFSLISYFLPFKQVIYVEVVLWSIMAIMTILRGIQLIRRIRQAGTLQKFLVERRQEKAVTKSLLATMTLNKNQHTPHISVPNVAVCDSRPSHLTVQIEKLAGMYDIERMTEDINSSFRGKLANYVVTSSIITPDGLLFKFLLEDIASDKTFRPAKIADLKMASHVLKLQEGLEVNLADSPHISVFGKSGSGKTTLLISILSQLFQQGADVRMIDGKTEFSSLNEFYPAEKICSDNASILALLEDVAEEIRKRQKIVADGVKKRQKMGLRAYDLGMRPLVVIADEVSSVFASMDSKERKQLTALLSQLVTKGRSVSCFLIVGNQSPKADVGLSTEIRMQFATKILLGSADQETQRMAFSGDVATKGGVEQFKGFYMSDGRTVQPQLFAVPDLHTYKLNDLQSLRKAYKMGEKIKFK